MTVPSETTVGFIGLGIMGKPMALNLVEAGYTVRVHNRSRGSVDELAGKGAQSATSPAEAATDADVVICMLPNSPDVEDVVLGEAGVRDGLRRGGVLIDMSTISPIVSRLIAEEFATRDVKCLDAPVSGGQQGAIDGTLSIMVGGEAATFEACRPLLHVMGSSVNHVGDAGAGQVAKACNQIVVAGTIQAVSEALTLASCAGVEPTNVRAALMGGFASSKVLEVHGQRILDRAFTPGFRVELHHKDLDIALATGATIGVPLQTTALIKELFGALIAKGAGSADQASLALLVEQLAGQPARELGAFAGRAP